jgi:hypothetical protein
MLSLTHVDRMEQIETVLAPLGKKLVVGTREPAWGPLLDVERKS